MREREGGSSGFERLILQVLFLGAWCGGFGGALVEVQVQCGAQLQSTAHSHSQRA